MRSPANGLEMPAELGPAAVAEWLQERDRYQRECGCGAGAVGALVGLGVAVVWLAATLTVLSFASAASALAVVAAGSIAGGLGGKLTGLARARRRFRLATARLLAQQAIHGLVPHTGR